METKLLMIGMVVLLTCTLNYSSKQQNDNYNTYLNINKDKVITYDIQDELYKSLPQATLEERKITKEPEWINIRVSFYTNSYANCGKTDGIGSANIRLSRGSIAAPSDIPMFSKLYIEGIGETTVHDRGGAIKWMWKDGIKYMKVDVFVPNATQKQLMKKGIMNTRGFIIKD